MRDVLFVIAVDCAAACAAGFAAPDKDAAPIIVQLPAEKIDEWRVVEADVDLGNDSVPDGHWDAQGVIFIPADKKVFFALYRPRPNRSVPTDAAPLDAFPPDVIRGLMIPWSRLTREQFEHLPRHTALRFLSFDFGRLVEMTLSPLWQT